MVKIPASPRPPKRLFKDRHDVKAAMDAAIGPIPPQMEPLRQAAKAIDPLASYSVEVDGQVVTATGAELLETARLYLALADAHQAGDKAALRRAALAILAHS